MSRQCQVASFGGPPIRTYQSKEPRHAATGDASGEQTCICALPQEADVPTETFRGCLERHHSEHRGAPLVSSVHDRFAIVTSNHDGLVSCWRPPEVGT